MLSLYFGLIMFLCIVPTSIIWYVQVYPKKWKDRNLILGVKNREEYRTGETLKRVEKIYGKYRGAARLVVIVICAISCCLLLLKGMTLITTVWTSFIFISLFALSVPMFLGNKEMKNLKRSIGIGKGEKVSYVDLSNAGAVHALKFPQVIGPNAIGLLLVIMALLVDFRVIHLERGWYAGTFLGTGVSAMFWCMGILITVLGFVMDGLKNEVISEDSAINANYNRAKKKNMADAIVAFLWVNAAYAILGIGSFFFFYTEILFMATLAIYMALIMAGVMAFVLREKKIEERYAKETSILEDDDDYWLAGMFYYNPKDKRLNVEKRVGVGGTVNLGHPVGKLLGVLAGLALVATIVLLVGIGMMESTPMKMHVENDKVICHHLWDEYVIDVDDVLEVEYVGTSTLRMSRVMGVGMETMLKGDFIVNDEKGCKVFLWRANGNCIVLRTADHAYYLNAVSEEETLKTYEELLEKMGK